MRGKAFDITPEQDKFFKENYLLIPAKTMSRMQGLPEGVGRRRMKKLGIVVPPEVLEKFKQDSYIKKGSTPMNKGLKQADYMTKEAMEACAKTRYKTGDKPKNTLFDHAITLRADNRGKFYKWIRVAEAKWEMLHVYNWKQAGNEIPEGYILRFKNGDTLNPEVDNLELITRAQHLYLNRKHDDSSKVKVIKERVPKPIVAKNTKALSEKATKTGLTAEQKVELKQARLEKQQQDKLNIKLKKAALRTEEREKRNQLKLEVAEQKAESKQLKLDRKSREADILKKQKEQRDRLQAIEQHRAKLRKKEKEPLFTTRAIDYSHMTAVRVDHKTVIYAKPGQDPEAVRLRYLLSVNKAG